MSYRKLTVNQEVFQYSIGRTHTKVKGRPVFKNSDIGDKIFGTDDYVVTPYNVANAILGVKHERIVQKCHHGTITHKTTINPFDAEIYGQANDMIDCKKCVHELKMDI